ncbi:HotDog domain-containing protein [Microdochium trichocladiopsis]|uniref:HotDog domain-containing protein n=1 Tax=Microdochium trichocladiopsis TaxID=1682393 RepID=A0A9P8YIV1_9PEZI|nr:HotDog domain-containing protein [Microdochium trichocladiopsis]KAH7039835.1 HotDog domain-containing protein [Microdochium trichocladiopsis]
MASKGPDVSGKRNGKPTKPGSPSYDKPGPELIQQWLDRGKDPDPEYQNWMSSILPHLTLESHSADGPHPAVTLRFAVKPEHCNDLNNMHGGCTATLFDFATTMPIMLISKPGFWEYLGVSRTLNTTYLRPIPCGTSIIVEADILQIGKRMTTTRGSMHAINEDGSKGAVLAVCEHGKACVDPPKM